MAICGKAGLFSAVATGFGVLCYTVLTDPSAASAPPALHRYVAALWFTSLVCALAAAVVDILLVQWLNQLLTPAGLGDIAVGPRQRLRIWNLRQATFRKWRVEIIHGIPSFLLQIALSLFLAALVGFLWSLDLGVAIPNLVLVILVLLFQATTLVVPAIIAYSPFQTQQAQWARWVCVHILYRIALAVHSFAAYLLRTKPLTKNGEKTKARDIPGQPPATATGGPAPASNPTSRHRRAPKFPSWLLRPDNIMDKTVACMSFHHITTPSCPSDVQVFK